MFDKRLAVTGAALAIVAATAITAALLPGQQEAPPLEEPVSQAAVSQGEVPQEPEDDYLYIMREHEGKIALFTRESSEPELVFEKLVKHLPEYDRILLREGIKIYSGDELSARIEDYIS